MRISGLVGEVRRIREALRRGIPAEEQGEFRERVRDAIASVHDILDLAGASAEDLPGPSRKAWAFLTGLDLADLPEPRDHAPAPPRVRIPGVVGAGRRLAAALSRGRDELMEDAAAAAALRAEAAERVASIREVLAENGADEAALPALSRRHLGFLAWLAREGNVERSASCLRSVVAAFPLPSGHRLKVGIGPLSGGYRYRRRGILHELRVSAALAAASPEVPADVARAAVGDAAAGSRVREFLRSRSAREIAATLDPAASPRRTGGA